MRPFVPLLCALTLATACSSKFSITEKDPETGGGDDGVGFDGADGADGTDGADGADGVDGGDGSDGTTATDADGDGWPADEDCDDADASRFPGAEELCDGIDNDCDDDVDEGVLTTFYADADADGYGVDADAQEACEAPAGTSPVGGDCDDAEPAVNPAAAEVCDGLDNDCSGGVDEGLTATFYADADGDGFGTSATTVDACTQPSGYASNDADCDDSSAAAFPGGVEVCDSLDNDCNGTVDDGVGSTWYLDSDGDGYGASGSGAQACSQPTGRVADDTDCNDANASVNPAATEVCDGVDNDCDSATPETGSVTFTDAAGAVTSATSTFSGTSGSPASATLSSDGTYTFCDGTFYTNIEVTADVTLESAQGATVTTLDGGGAGSVVLVDTAGLSVTIDGLTLTNGSGSGAAFGLSGTGGDISCDAASALTVTDSVLTDNDATDGGGLAADGCTVTLESVVVSDNTATYGAGIDFGNASATFTDVDIADNAASTSGGGLYLSTDSSAADVTFTGGSITGNSATYGGAVMLDGSGNNAALDMSGAEVTDNTVSSSAYSGVALVYDDADLRVAYGQWGTSAGGDDNSTDDVTALDASALDYDDYGDDAWFQCDEGGCETYVYDSVSGAALFLYGYSPSATSLNCELYFAVTGAGTSTVCDDCAFALDMDLAYSASASTNDGTCSTNDAAWVMGYAPDPTYYSSPVVYYQYSSTWYATFYGDFDGEYLTFGGGHYQYPYGSYYYTNYWYAAVIPE